MDNNRFWKKYSDLIQGDFIERKYWHSAKAVYNYKGYKIFFDNYSMRATVDVNNYESVVTRIYCQFTSKKRMDLKIHRTTLVNRILTVFRKDRLKVHDITFDSKYFIFLNKETSLTFLNRSIKNKIIDFHIKDLYIAKKDGIWGDVLANDIYELATFFDKAKVDYAILNNIKILFEEIIDELEVKYQINPVKGL